MKLSMLFSASLVLAGCAGTPFKWEDTEKIHNGMSESEVVAILGKPYSRTQTGNLTILTWSNATACTGAKAVSYSLRDGRVVGATSINK